MKYEDLAKDIIQHVGGEKNIISLRHCITRLRFQLVDETKADTEYLKQREGIVTVVKNGGQYQVVIGNHVSEVYDAILSITSIDNASNEKSSGNIIERLIDLVSGLFQPFLGTLAATGIIKGLVAILGIFGLTSETSGLVIVLNAAGDAFFQYLPLVIAVSAARRFKLDTYVALAIVGGLIYPNLANLTSGEALYTLFEGTIFQAEIYQELLGIPIIMPPSGSYYSSIIPAIFAVWLGSVLYKWIKKWMPGSISNFFTPFLTILLSVILSFVIIGPLTTWLSNLIGLAFDGVYNFSPVLFTALVATSWQVLVIFGLHWSLVPIAILQLTQYGESSVFAGSSVGTFGVFAALLAIYIKTKNSKEKSILAPTILTAFFCITEPAIYGYMLPMKKFFGAALLGNFAGGVYTGLTQVTTYRMGGLGVFGLPNYILEGEGIGPNFWNRIISWIITVIVAFVISMFIKIDKEDPVKKYDEKQIEKNNINNKTKNQNNDMKQREVYNIYSPIDGEIVSLDKVNDSIFSSGTMGKGIAISPNSEGKIIAPCDGEIKSLFSTGHAIGITSEKGVDLLIHIGIDTVEMEGEGFEILVSQGDTIQAGEPLIYFDPIIIEKAGFSSDVIVIVTNSDSFQRIEATETNAVKVGDNLLTIIK
ncbi:beta-glucoside-specific PTS transporter subunit IIABC [Aerococcus loyolae]|uniref:Beta-glucoside-specific PTS transporter subunit IIABC n=1 Tax=Aerococcus loyolae TaxID=2976809 RepID=A0ABT4BYF7_9LACT|nr:beta-glucoside-specific PTS transporter subunit IIABC [Aerococcus loyolae]MCY3025274.1 beta-glucoside-specific PTS transporter subunit IIABC [Aerococcus loyolae]MCY3027063.1 beta-glucoside-specific PTS transporter subunit IIABC [Aerococcus loyolae]MCY3028646.1 beta-glucoside-specific PTS transporter subunit IIABC [Aerococcus loyolae]OAM70597.1 PTS beta-glucoside transporter subunit EIIBCA [Aerococcus loyolae]